MLLVVLVYIMPIRTTVIDDNDGSLEKGEIIDMAFKLVGQSQYNPQTIYEQLRWKVGSPITLWENISEKNTLNDFSEREEFVIPANVDLQNYNLLLSYGRKIVGMEYQLAPYYGELNYALTIIFAEQHEGNVIFFYQIDKKTFVPWNLEPQCNVMEGDEKIYIEDIRNLNEYDIDREGYSPGV